MLLSDVCWDCLVCGSHFWAITGFRAAFCHRQFWIPVRDPLELCFWVTTERENSLGGQMCSYTCAKQGHCCSTSCTGVWVLSSVVTLEADEHRSRVLHCTQSSHTEAPSALLLHFLQLQGKDSMDSIAFWYFVSGLMCANWNFHSVLFCQTLLLCQMSCF